MCEKMKMMGFSDSIMRNVFRVVSGILFLGNIDFEGDEFSSKIIDDN